MKLETSSATSPTIALDRGLRLLQLARDEGAIRVMDAAEELGVSRSSAHRLLQALLFRDFLVQDERRRYLPGPAMAVRAIDGNIGGRLRRLAEPHMRWLTERTGHSCNLMLRAEREVRFLRCVTVQNGTRDRRGFVTSAQSTAAGLSMLASLEPGELSVLYQRDGVPIRLSGVEFHDLALALTRVRRDGYATALRPRDGLFAVGTVVNHASAIRGGLGLAVSMPSSERISRRQLDALVVDLHEARVRIESEAIGCAVRAGDPL